MEVIITVIILTLFLYVFYVDARYVFTIVQLGWLEHNTEHSPVHQHSKDENDFRILCLFSILCNFLLWHKKHNNGAEFRFAHKTVP